MPNHPRWPLLVYPGAVEIAGADPAATFERLFDRNHRPAAWRNGVFQCHHFNATAHEAPGICEGEVAAQSGGEGGVPVTARPGDVVVLSAGTGHTKLNARGAPGLVGAYPAGPHPDTCTPLVTSARRAAEAVARVPLPECNRAFGADGPLFEHWRR
jgi:uncharacterized protein YjlB